MNNSKLKVNHLGHSDVGKLRTVPADLKKLSDLAENDVI